MGATRKSWWTASVSRRINLVMLLVVLLMIAAATITLRGLNALNRQLDDAMEQQHVAAAQVERMLEESRRLSDSAQRAASAASAAERTAALADLDAAKKALGERIDEISAQLGNAPELQRALQEGFSSFVISAVKASRLLEKGRQQDAERELLTAFNPKLLAYVLMSVSGVSQHNRHSMQAVAKSGHDEYSDTLSLLLPIMGAALLALLATQRLLQRTVIKPVRRVAYAAEQLAAGKFDVDLAAERRDECGEMLESMASLRQRLVAMSTAIESASHSVVRTADTLADNNQELSVRSNEQTQALQAAAGAIQALTHMSLQSADNAQRISLYMQSACGAAQRGSTVIADVVTTMNATAQASRRIADTIGMIHEIAFKTNILALNAAVEAARAGEHGRSFAVVAAEVRALASKSAAAAREIDALIADSMATVEHGSKLVAGAGVVIGEIVRHVQTAAGQMNDISDASHVQSRHAGEVTHAMNEIESCTRHTSEMVSQATASAATLRQEAQALQDSVSEFAHGRSGASSAPYDSDQSAPGAREPSISCAA